MSSSAHVRLLEQYFTRFSLGWFDGVQAHAPLSTAHEALNHFYHGPTLIIVAALFYPKWWFLLKNWRRCWRTIIKIGALTLLADCMTALFYFCGLSKIASVYVLGVGLVITAALLFSLRWCPSKSGAHWGIGSAVLLGVVQGIALLPGISRMASTYVAARWLRFAPHKAFELSLLIQWPLIAAAFCNSVRMLGFSSIKAVFLNPLALMLMLCAMGIAYVGLKLVQYMCLTGRAWWFSVYMVVPFMAWLWLMLV